MFSNNDRISLRQIKRLMILDIFSATVVLLIPVITRIGGSDGIGILFFGYLVAMLYGLYLLWVYKKAGKDYFDFSKEMVGKVGLVIVTALYIIKMVISLSFFLSYFTYVIHNTLLPETNEKIILIVFVAVAAYEAFLGMEERARVAELLLPFIMIPFIIFFITGMTKVDVSNLTPFFIHDTKTFVYGTYCMLAFYGVLELLLMTMPYAREADFIKNPDKNYKDQRKSVCSAITVSFVLQLLLFIVTTGILGVNQTSQNLYSSVTVMQVVNLPGGFVKRQDAILIGFWIFSSFILLGTLMFFLSYSFKKMCGAKKHKNFILIVSVIVFIGAMLMVNIESAFDLFGKYMLYIGIPQSFLIPLVLIGIRAMKGVKKHE